MATQTLKIGLDMDGTITDGTHHLTLRNNEVYSKLALYDEYTWDVYRELVLNHEVYIITARWNPEVLTGLVGYLQSKYMPLPTGILTHQWVSRKHKLVKALGLDLYFDDSPEILDNVERFTDTEGYLMDNPGWPANQEYTPALPRVFSWQQLKEIVNARINTQELH